MINDLSSVRRGSILELEDVPGGKVIQATVPLKSLLGYSTALRSLSHGHASYEMAFSHQGPVSQHEADVILKERFGL